MARAAAHAARRCSTGSAGRWFALRSSSSLPGNTYLPLIVFVLLVALGSDYNIFVTSRIREESATGDLRAGIRRASARTGTVVTSAGVILAGTFGSLMSAPLILFQIGFAVALGVLIDTLIVRSILVPALAAGFGEWSWWPSRRGVVVASLTPP